MRIAITEDSFAKVFMKINGISTKGRDVYGYFLTEEEFRQTKTKWVSSGHLGSLGWETDTIYLMDAKCASFQTHFRTVSCPDLDKEYIKKIERGAFIVGSDDYMLGFLTEKHLPVRKINLRSLLFGFQDDYLKRKRRWAWSLRGKT